MARTLVRETSTTILSQIRDRQALLGRKECIRFAEMKESATMSLTVTEITMAAKTPFLMVTKAEKGALSWRTIRQMRAICRRLVGQRNQRLITST